MVLHPAGIRKAMEPSTHMIAPAAAWNAVSLKTIIRPSSWRISLAKRYYSVHPCGKNDEQARFT
jgi:hypothetical protein